MKTRWWRGGALLVLCGVLAGCASGPARADSVAVAAPAQATSAAPVVASAAAPDVPPTDGQTAFLNGYRAYQSRDYPRAIENLKYAADHFPTLGDHALYYLGLAQHDQGDLNASAETLDRLVKTYPRSVIDRSRRDDAGGQSVEAWPQRRSLGGRVAADRAGAGSVDRGNCSHRGSEVSYRAWKSKVGLCAVDGTARQVSAFRCRR